MKQNLTRILIGLLAVFVIGQMAKYLYPSFEPNGDDPLSAIDSYVVRVSAIAYTFAFFATAVGGFIAREKFVVPAMTYAAVKWTYGVYLGLSITSISSQEHLGSSIPVGELVLSTLLSTLPALLIGLAVAAAGSLAGMKLFAVISSRRAEAQ